MPETTTAAAIAPHPSPVKAILKSVGSRVGWVLINALTGVITAHALGASGRGALAAMIIWPVFLAGALTFGLPSALVYRLRLTDGADRVSLFTAATLLATAIGIVASVAGFFILPWWLSNYDPQTIRYTQWFMLFTVVSMLTLIFRGAFEAIGHFGKSASSWILSPAQTLLSLLLLFHFHRLTVLTAALSYVLAGIPVLIWMFLRLNRELGWTLHDFNASSRTLLSYGLRSYGIDLCGALSQSVDQALVIGMISAAEMGRYVVALSLSRTLSAIYQAAAVVLFPRCVGLTRRLSLEATLQMTAACTAIVIPGAAILYFFGGTILHTIYGSEYAIAADLLRLLILEAVVSGIITLMSQPFMAIGKPGTVTILQAIGLVGAVGLLFLLVPRFGTVGAGLALLGSAMLRLLLLAGAYVHFAGRFPRTHDLVSLAGSLSPSNLRRLVPTRGRAQ